MTAAAAGRHSPGWQGEAGVWQRASTAIGESGRSCDECCGVCAGFPRVARRLDIKVYPPRSRATAIMYFTGSGLTCRLLRWWAGRPEPEVLERARKLHPDGTHFHLSARLGCPRRLRPLVIASRPSQRWLGRLGVAGWAWARCRLTVGRAPPVCGCRRQVPEREDRRAQDQHARDQKQTRVDVRRRVVRIQCAAATRVHACLRLREAQPPALVHAVRVSAGPSVSRHVQACPRWACRPPLAHVRVQSTPTAPGLSRPRPRWLAERFVSRRLLRHLHCISRRTELMGRERSEGMDEELAHAPCLSGHTKEQWDSWPRNDIPTRSHVGRKSAKPAWLRRPSPRWQLTPELENALPASGGVCAWRCLRRGQTRARVGAALLPAAEPPPPCRELPCASLQARVGSAATTTPRANTFCP